MKKFILFILGLVLLCSCECETVEQAKKRHAKELEDRVQNETVLIDLSLPDEYGQIKTHQMALYYHGDGNYKTSAMTHWPDCKYCKRGQ